MGGNGDCGEEPTLLVTDSEVAIVQGRVRYPLRGGNQHRVVLTHTLLTMQGHEYAVLYLTGLLDGLSHQAQLRIEEMARDEELQRNRKPRAA